MRLSAGAVGVVGAMLVAGLGVASADQEPITTHTTFRAGVERFTLSVVVRDGDGRLVRDLTRDDFEVLDRGIPQPVIEFRAEPAPVSLAILLDVSGSMVVGGNLARARDAAFQLLGWLDAPGDEVALFTFDTRLRDLGPFDRPSALRLDDRFATLRPFGTTSLRDAIAGTARRVTERAAGRHRAVVVLTDGVDTSSLMTAAEVSAAASAIHVPVYVLMTVSRVDPRTDGFGDGELSNLARWTGGALLSASQPAQFSRAAREIVAELRQHYWLAVEPGEEPGWHPLEVRTRDGRLSVRARSGYVIAPGPVTRGSGLGDADGFPSSNVSDR